MKRCILLNECSDLWWLNNICIFWVQLFYSPLLLAFRKLVLRWCKGMYSACYCGNSWSLWNEAIGLKWLVWAFISSFTRYTGSNTSGFSGLADPYVKGQLGPYKFRTRTQKKTLSPKWHEEFKIPIFTWESDNMLAIEVRDKDRVFDDSMG